MASVAVDIPIGTVVDIPLGRGVVRFCGTTSFSSGKWVGIELSQPVGKNDGSVNGVPYFSCRMHYGVFVKASQVKVVQDPPSSGSPTSQPVARSTLGHSRTPSAGLSRVSSSRSIPPPSPRATSPSKLGPNQSTRGTTRLAPPSPTKRSPIPTARQQSGLKRASLAPRRPSMNESNLSISGSATPSRGDSPDSASLVRTSQLRQVSSPAQQPRDRVLPGVAQASITVSTSNLLPPAPQSPQEPRELLETNDEELQELRAKIRVLEVKRADDARHVKELETKLSEAETFVALRPKLQAKLMQQQTELIAARRELADARQLSELAETRNLDSLEQLEMTMLDREVAEERAEAAESELEELKEKLAVAEVELEVIKEGASAEGGGSSVANSLAYIQLEKQNARLKDALIRLRDVSQETEQEQRRRIADMEKDVMSVEDLSGQLESTLIKLANADTQIEDLKLQLDDALGAEEMVVQLTERTLTLGEKIEEMRITIEDLEALKELGEELEENHVETERVMQDEINEKDVLLAERQQRIESLEEACQDMERTIGRFRELVIQLESELEMLRSETQNAQTESAAAASQTAAIMSMNFKNQARSIDHELKRIEANESKEMLDIVQPYLPQIYTETDSDATRCYIFFQRMASKTDLINMITAQAHNLPESLNGSVSETLVGVCEMRGAIAVLSTLCKRFVAILRCCDVESFIRIGRLFQEIAPLEKRIDMHIELLRRDEFREMECTSDINKIQAQFDHLAETYFKAFDFDLGERELGLVLSLDHDLDVYASSMGLTKTAVETILDDEDVVHDLDGLEPEKCFLEPIQKSLDQCRNAKVVARKLMKRLEELAHESSALKAHLVPQLEALCSIVSEMVNFGIQLAQQTMPHIDAVRASKSSFQLSKVLSFVNDIASSTVAKICKDPTSSWASLGKAISELVVQTNALSPKAMEHDNIIKITGTAPWIVRIEEVKTAMAVNVEAERKVTHLNEEMQGLVRTLKGKDQNIQESAVKIELMERRMEAAKKQAEAVTELEGLLGKAQKQEKYYVEAMEQLQSEFDTLAKENSKLKTTSSASEKVAGATTAQSQIPLHVDGNLETTHLLEQLESYRGAVRFLRMENSYLKGNDLMRELGELPPLPVPTSSRRSATPALDPSNLSDTDESDADPSPKVPSVRSLATETKALYKEVIKFSSTARVVDLSATKKSDGNTKAWMPKKKTPTYQVWERKAQAEHLNRRVQGLLERTNAMVART
ncbi:dynein associated protein-domain-containing protein [Russula brevipes]|nr:dynein associated protein-domain-containing protein [Russula brevipes]